MCTFINDSIFFHFVKFSFRTTNLLKARIAQVKYGQGRNGEKNFESEFSLQDVKNFDGVHVCVYVSKIIIFFPLFGRTDESQKVQRLGYCCSGNTVKDERLAITKIVESFLSNLLVYDATCLLLGDYRENQNMWANCAARLGKPVKIFSFLFSKTNLFVYAGCKFVARQNNHHRN